VAQGNALMEKEVKHIKAELNHHVKGQKSVQQKAIAKPKPSTYIETDYSDKVT
jgi:hypothetical protein